MAIFYLKFVSLVFFMCNTRLQDLDLEENAKKNI